MTPPTAERRRFPRYPLRGCRLEYRVDSLLGLMSDTSSNHIVLNLSGGGLYFITKKKLKKPTKLEITITSPLIGFEIILARARVLWFKEIPDHKIYGIGVQFTAMEALGRKRLETLIKKTSEDIYAISRQVQIDKVSQPKTDK